MKRFWLLLCLTCWAASSSAVDFSSATNELVRTVLKSQLKTASLFGVRKPVSSAEWKIVAPVEGGDFALPYERCWVFQVDSEPFAVSFTRSRRVVVFSEDLSASVVYDCRLPVMLRRIAGGGTVALEALNDGSVARSAEPRTAVTIGAAARSAEPLANTENNTNLFAVLISGGYDPANNGIRFFGDIRNAYQTLREKCGVPRENIFTFVASGVETNAEHYSNGKYVAVDYDLDGDGTNDVSGGAYNATVSNCFHELSKRLTSRDRLLVAYSSHGGKYDPSDYSSWRTVGYMWNEYAFDDEFVGWTGGIGCPIAFLLGQCFSGGFADDAVSRQDRVVGTAANYLESSWGYDYYNIYMHEFFGAVSSGAAVTFYDAAKAAHDADNLIANPQYAESTSHLGHDFRFDSLASPVTEYDEVRYDLDDDDAVSLTESFDYPVDEENWWQPDAFSANGLHEGWTATGDGFTADWIPFSSAGSAELAGMSGVAAAMVKPGKSFAWRWTAPESAGMKVSLEGSYANATIVIREDGNEVARKADSGHGEWSSVAFFATEGTEYTITISTSSALVAARLSWQPSPDRYVAADGRDDNDGLSPESPFKTIQAAIDAADEYATIHVAPGRYAPISSGNRCLDIVADEDAENTFIDGGGTSRCADLRSRSDDDCDTFLIGFTLENGYASGGDAHGAGVRCGSLVRCIVRNCLASDTGKVKGGAAYCGCLYDCLVYGNTASCTGSYVYGGACYRSTLYNCTVVDNSVSAPNGTAFGGGVYVDGKGGWTCNSIIVGNSVSAKVVYGENAYNYGGIGFTKTRSGGDAKFVDRANHDYRLAEGSPCIDAGYDDMHVDDVDLAGNDRVRGGGIDLGCYESAYTADVPAEPESSPARGGRHYGVLVGINEFASPSVRDLNGCVSDALGMRERCLKSGLWHEEDVSVFTNGLATESAVRSAIAGYAAVAQPGDTFVFMQSSHGGNDSGDQMSAFLCMHDFYVGSGGYDGSYCDSELAEDLMEFPDGVKVVVYVDACRSGGLFQDWDSPLANDLTLLGTVARAESSATAWDFASRVRQAMERPALCVRTACAARSSIASATGSVSTNIAFVTAADYDQYSWDSGNGGAFTTAFTGGWSSGDSDADADGKLDFYELYCYAASIATGYWYYVDYRTEAQCDNAELLASVLAGYVPGVWPEPEIDPGDTPEEQAAKVQDAMIGAGFPEETAKAVTNADAYACLQNWSYEKGYSLSEVAASPVALISPALGADELLSDMTSNDLQVVEMSPLASGTEWKMSLSITDYDAAKVNEALLKSAIGVVGANDLGAKFTSDDLEISVEKGAETVNLTVKPPDDEEKYFMRAKVR